MVRNSCASTCAGSRCRRARSVFETKVLWAELFHVVTHCEKGDEAEKVRACVRVCAQEDEDEEGG